MPPAARGRLTCKAGPSSLRGAQRGTQAHRARSGHPPGPEGLLAWPAAHLRAHPRNAELASGPTAPPPARRAQCPSDPVLGQESPSLPSVLSFLSSPGPTRGLFLEGEPRRPRASCGWGTPGSRGRGLRPLPVPSQLGRPTALPPGSGVRPDGRGASRPHAPRPAPPRSGLQEEPGQHDGGGAWGGDLLQVLLRQEVRAQGLRLRAGRRHAQHRQGGVAGHPARGVSTSPPRPTCPRRRGGHGSEGHCPVTTEPPVRAWPTRGAKQARHLPLGLRGPRSDCVPAPLHG